MIVKKLKRQSGKQRVGSPDIGLHFPKGQTKKYYFDMLYEMYSAMLNTSRSNPEYYGKTVITIVS